MKLKFWPLLLAALVLFADSASVAQNFWEPANGTPVGSCTAIVIANNGTIVDFTYGSNESNISGCDVFTSADNGKTWNQDTQKIDGVVLTAVRSPNGHLFAPTASRLYRSTDNGFTWTWISDTLGNSLVIDSSGNLIVGWGTSVWVPGRPGYYYKTWGVTISKDEGLSWEITPFYNWTQPWSISALPTSSIALDIDKNNNIFAAINYGLIFKSTDGTNWTQLPSNGLSGLVNTIGVTQSDDIFVGASDNGYTNGFYRLENSIWIRLNDGLSDSSIHSITVDDNGELFVTTGGGWFTRSTDKGSTWETVESDLGSMFTEDSFLIAQVFYATISPKDGRIVVSASPGICESTDTGITWRIISHGLPSLEISPFTVSEQGTLYACGGFCPEGYGWLEDGLFYSTDNGQTWECNPEPARRLAGLIAVGGYIFEQDLDRSLYYRSSNSGATWEPIDSGLPPPDSIYNFYTPGPFTDGCGNLLCCLWDLQSRNQIWFVSTDLGNSWHKCESGIPNQVFNSFTSDKSCNIFASCGNGVFRSTDVCENWEQINFGLTDTVIYSIAVDSSGNIFAISDSSRIFYSIDDGNTWKYLSRLDSDSVGNQGAALLTDSRGSIYAATSVSGVFLSTDEGKSWNKIASGLGDSDIVSLVLSPNGYLFAATSAHGVYRSVNTTLDGVQSAPAPSSSISLTQNSPNPVTQSTTIAFTLPEPSYITLTLYDATGREVAALASGFMGAGEHDLPFQRGNLPSGVYFYRLESGGQSQTRAMVILP